MQSALGLESDPPISAADLIGLTELTANDSDGVDEIVSLSGLECAMNLEVLELGHNSIVDLGPLEGSTQLRKLQIPYNPIDDVSPLAGLSEFE